MRAPDRKRDHLLQLGHTVAPADKVRGGRQRQGRDANHPDVAGGLAAHSAERALHIPKRRKNDRPGLAPGRTEVWLTEFSGVPAYTPRWRISCSLGRERQCKRSWSIGIFWRIFRSIPTIPELGRKLPAGIHQPERARSV